MITQQALKNLLKYESTTGKFCWLVKPNLRWPIDKEPGTINDRGYRKICLRHNGKRQVYRAHRLAWLYVYGEWPDRDIDHINGNLLDNRICNLRLATKHQNSGNRKINANNKCGYKGVYNRRGKWAACIRADGKTVNLGLYDTPLKAHEAYMCVARKYFGEFARAK